MKGFHKTVVYQLLHNLFCKYVYAITAQLQISGPKMKQADTCVAVEVTEVVDSIIANYCTGQHYEKNFV